MLQRPIYSLGSGWVDGGHPHRSKGKEDKRGFWEGKPGKGITFEM